MIKPQINALLNILVQEIDSIFFSVLNRDFVTEVKQKINLLMTEKPKKQYIDEANKLLNQLQQIINKEQKQISFVSIFFSDGRHLSDIYLTAENKLSSRSGGKETLYSAALASINMFIQEAVQSDEIIDEIAIGIERIYFVSGEKLMIAVHSKSTELLIKSKILSILRKIEIDYKKDLQGWMGDVAIFHNICDYFRGLEKYFLPAKTNTL